MQTAAPYSRKSETLQRQPSTTDRYAAMSPPVSPCQWRDRGSGSSEPKGLTHSRKAAFLRGWKSGDVDSFRTPPPAAPPLSALSRGRGGHCAFANFAVFSLFPHCYVSQFHRSLNSHLSTLNSQSAKILICGLCGSGFGETVIQVIISVICLPLCGGSCINFAIEIKKAYEQTLFSI